MGARCDSRPPPSSLFSPPPSDLRRGAALTADDGFCLMMIMMMIMMLLALGGWKFGKPGDALRYVVHLIAPPLCRILHKPGWSSKPRKAAPGGGATETLEAVTGYAARRPDIQYWTVLGIIEEYDTLKGCLLTGLNRGPSHDAY
ncbi:hypothetical protein LY76DRAFT_639253 [Colletotrichum caudatum]|nr:hypothetical protein LY76DRAFT_639253 [Colletotrichum caudatum]